MGSQRVRHDLATEHTWACPHYMCKEELSCHASNFAVLVIFTIIPCSSFNIRFTLSVELFLSAHACAMILSICKTFPCQLPLQIYLHLSVHFTGKVQIAFPVLASFNFWLPMHFLYSLTPISWLNQQSFWLLPSCQVQWSILFSIFFLFFCPPLAMRGGLRDLSSLNLHS